MPSYVQEFAEYLETFGLCTEWCNNELWVFKSNTHRCVRLSEYEIYRVEAECFLLVKECFELEA